MVTSVDFSSTSAASALAARSRSYGTWENAFATQLNRLAALDNLPAEARAAALARDPSLAAAAAKQEEIEARNTAAKAELLGLPDTPFEEDPEGNPTVRAGDELRRFPAGVTWADARAMVTRNKVVGDQIMPDKLRSAVADQSVLGIANQYRLQVDEDADGEALAAQLAAEAEAKASLLEAGLGEQVLAAITALGLTPDPDNVDGFTPDGLPERFPEGLSWVYLRQKIAVPQIDGVELDAEALEKTLVATEKLAEAGITALYPTWPPGTTVLQAFEDSLRQNKNNILTNIFVANDLSLRDFPSKVSRYQAYKMVEDPTVPGGIDAEKVTALKTDLTELKSLGIYDIGRFKSLGGTTPTRVLELINERPEKFRPTQAELEKSKPNWKIPPTLVLNGPVTGPAWEAATIAHAMEYNPDYSEEEIMARYGFNTVRVLGQGEKL